MLVLAAEDRDVVRGTEQIEFAEEPGELLS